MLDKKQAGKHFGSSVDVMNGNNNNLGSLMHNVLQETINEGSTNLIVNLERMEKLLVQHSQSDLVLYQIDRKARDYGTYFFASYSETKDLHKSMQVFERVRSLVRYIMFSDLYYEKAEEKYDLISRDIIRSIEGSINSSSWISLQASIEMFLPFWKFEKALQQRMTKGDKISLKEIRNHNLLKSKDAYIYSSILDHELYNFNHNVATVIHYNQALQDLLDDFEDIEDDINDSMPNVFVLLAISENGLKINDSLFLEVISKMPNVRQNIVTNRNVEVVLR